MNLKSEAIELLLFLTADLTFSITFSIPSGESLQGKGKSFRFLASLTLVEITELSLIIMPPFL